LKRHTIVLEKPTICASYSNGLFLEYMKCPSTNFCFSSTQLCSAIILLFFACSFLYAQESTALLCADGIDNDNNGFTDCEDPSCLNLLLPPDLNGCEVCGDGASFGDIVIAYNSGCPISDDDTSGALGINDFVTGTDDRPAYVFLGDGGYIRIGFTDNLLSNSGNTDHDLWVFEVAFGELKFNEVKLTDVKGDNDICDPTNIGPGADIDAICALTSIDIPEATNTLCKDGIDNDMDGFIDCEDPDCLSFYMTPGIYACEECADGFSFGDILLDYQSGCDISDPNPSGALGANDYAAFTGNANAYVYLGDGGHIDIGFTDNLLVNSGSSNPDLLVFEVEPVVEATSVALRPFDATTESFHLVT